MKTNIKIGDWEICFETGRVKHLVCGHYCKHYNETDIPVHQISYSSEHPCKKPTEIPLMVIIVSKAFKYEPS